MKKILVLLSLAVVVILTARRLGSWTPRQPEESFPPKADQSLAESSDQTTSYEILATNLEIPWELVFLPDGRMLVTERPGRVLLIDKETRKYEVKEVAHIGEGGLLGMALDPDFSKNSFIYLYFTYKEGGKVLNKVQRFIFDGQNLTADKVIIDGIAGSSNHDGGRIKFGPDRALYITTGDAENSSSAQDLNSLNGKILRYDGEKVEVYSYGHRNPQGLAWDSDGNLWATEHGPSGIWPNCCQDEANLIKKGSNYGWPDSRGGKVAGKTVGPVIHSGRDVWAPSGSGIKDGKLYFAGLRGEALYSMNLATKELKTYFKGEFGRIRSVTIGPDGYFYLITSNRDGRNPNPTEADDRIIKIPPEYFK